MLYFLIGIVAALLIAMFMPSEWYGQCGHKPSGMSFDGVGLASRCIKCGSKIQQDSQGNWY